MAYVEAKNAGTAPARLRVMAQKIEEVDTQLRMIETGPLLYAGIVYYYWRLGETSADVGQAMNLKPPHVRQCLYRMRRSARELGYENKEGCVVRARIPPCTPSSPCLL